MVHKDVLVGMVQEIEGLLFYSDRMSFYVSEAHDLDLSSSTLENITS